MPTGTDVRFCRFVFSASDRHPILPERKLNRRTPPASGRVRNAGARWSSFYESILPDGSRAPHHLQRRYWDSNEKPSQARDDIRLTWIGQNRNFRWIDTCCRMGIRSRHFESCRFAGRSNSISIPHHQHLHHSKCIASRAQHSDIAVGPPAAAPRQPSSRFIESAPRCLV